MTFLRTIKLFSWLLFFFNSLNAAPNAYITSFTNDIYAIDTANNNKTSIPVSTSTYEVVVSNDGTRAYVSNNDDFVYVIDTATNTLITTVNAGPIAGYLGVTSDGSKVFVTNIADSRVSVIDTQNFSVSTVTVGDFPDYLTITPDGNKVYVTNSGSDSISVIDVATLSVIATINTPPSPCYLEASPDNTRVLVINDIQDEVIILDTATDTIITTLPTGISPTWLTFTPNGQRGYVANLGTDNVTVVDMASNSVIETVPVGQSPVFIESSPDGSQVYTINNGSDTITAIDTTDFTVTQIAAGNSSLRLAFTPDATKAYMTDLGSDTISIINAQNNTLSGTIPADSPYYIAIAPPQPILGISKNATPNPVSAGAFLIYTIDYVNSGLGYLFDGVITDQIPANTTLQATVPNATVIGNQITWSIGTLAPGSGGSVSIIVRVDSNVPSGTQIINSSYSISGIGSSPVFGTPVITTVGAPALAISKNATPNPVDAGSSITYTINYFNSGSVSLMSGIVTDQIPANTTLVSTTPSATVVGNEITWSLGTLAANSGGSVQFVVNVDADLPNGSLITNSTYSISGINAAPVFGAPVVTTVHAEIPPNPPSPPINLKGKQVKNIFLNYTDRVNIITWSAPANPPAPVEYRIYRNSALTDLAGTVQADHRLRFEDHNRRKNVTYTYYIVSVDGAGLVSTPAVIQVP